MQTELMKIIHHQEILHRQNYYYKVYIDFVRLWLLTTHSLFGVTVMANCESNYVCIYTTVLNVKMIELLKN